MTNRIDIDALTETLSAQLKEAIQNSFAKTKEYQQKLVAAATEEDVEDTLCSYLIWDKRNDDLHKMSTAPRVKAAELFNTMAWELAREFNAIVDAENCTIKFKWYGRSLSWPTHMLADRYKLHSGMFSFDSSFTTHEAYTEDDYLLHIGIDRDDDSMVLVDFGKLDTYRFPY